MVLLPHRADVPTMSELNRKEFFSRLIPPGRMTHVKRVHRSDLGCNSNPSECRSISVLRGARLGYLPIAPPNLRTKGGVLPTVKWKTKFRYVLAICIYVPPLMGPEESGCRRTRGIGFIGSEDCGYDANENFVS